MAIIDILTPYDAKKKAAHAAKTVKHGVSSPCFHPGSGAGPQTPGRPPALRGRSRSSSRDREGEQPACCLCSLSASPAQLVSPTPFSLRPLALFPRAAGHVVHLADCW